MVKASAVKYFDDKIPKPTSPPKLLPIFHSCDAIIFRSILESKKLLPTECPVFVGEHLLYLFYGRPAYKKRDTETNRMNSYLPISFILDWDYIPNAKRIAPFDTGAFAKGIYSNYMHPGMKVEHFLMRPEQSSAPKTTSYFFGKNGAYYAGKPKDKVTYDPLDFEIESYFQLIKGVGTEKADDRKTTIEIQLDNKIVLSKENLKAVILPSNFKNSKIVKEVIKDELKAKILDYESYGVPSADNYTHMLSLTKGFLLKNKYFVSK